MGIRRLAAAILATLFLLLFPAALCAEGDLKARAEEAFRNDRYPEAIDLYKKIVAEAPRDAFSLKRLALILSWEDRLDESIATYRQLLEVEPSNTEAQRELAKIYSWAGRYGESAGTYRALLRAQPADARLKLSLAEVLSWDGKNAEARSIYQELIAAKTEAIPAAVGMGDVASWEGDLKQAAQWYRQVLKADPNNERAQLGLARVHHWQGLDRAAVREVNAALEKFPLSKEAKKLHGEIHAPLRPALTPSYDRIIDTDGNDLASSRIGMNLHTDPQTTLDFVYSHYDAQFRCETAGECPGVVLTPLSSAVAETQADSVAGVFTTRFSDILFLQGRIGADRLENFEGRARSGAVGGASFDLYPTQKFGFGFATTHESLVDTARLIDNNIRLDATTASIDYKFATRWELRGSGQHAWFSDGNQRNIAYASLAVRIPTRRPRIRVTYASRWLSYQLDPQDPSTPKSGYFAPTRFLANLLSVAVGDELFHRWAYYSAEVTGGFQRFRPRPQTFGSGSDDTVFGWNVVGGLNITPRLAFEANYGRTDYAQQIASGFESRHFGYLLKIQF